MKWVPSKVGAEPKKLAILGGLVVAAVGLYWYNSGPSGSANASVTVKAPAPAAVPALKSLPAEVEPAIARDSSPMPFKRTQKGSASVSRSGQDFRPSMKPPDDFDVNSVDPAIHWDLLAKVRGVEASGGARSLFEFSKPPEPPAPKVAAIKVPLPAPAPPPVAIKPAEPPKPPPPPPIPLKYYGYTGRSGERAMFLDGDPTTGEPFVAGVGDTIKNRYKVVRIGLRSAVLEDTTTKNEQTLQIVEDAQQ